MRDGIIRRTLVTADIAAAVAAYLFAALVVGGAADGWQALLALPLVVGSSKLAGLYDRDGLLINRATSLDELPALFNIATLLALLAALAGDAFARGGLAPLPLLVLWLSLASFLMAFRVAARALVLRHTRPSGASCSAIPFRPEARRLPRPDLRDRQVPHDGRRRGGAQG